MQSLAEVGIKAHYVPLNDIATEEGKIGGAAQKRLAGGGMLHHVTMSYDIDADKMTQVLRIGREKISDKGITSAKKRVDPLKRQTGRSREEILDTLKAVFVQRYGAKQAVLDEDTLAQAVDLSRTKFLSEEWTRRVP
jgi:lipoate-protein ligase A